MSVRRPNQTPQSLVSRRPRRSDVRTDAPAARASVRTELFRVRTFGRGDRCDDPGECFFGLLRFPSPSRTCARLSKSGAELASFGSPTRTPARAIKSGLGRPGHVPESERSARPRARADLVGSGFRAHSTHVRARIGAEFRGQVRTPAREKLCRRRGFLDHYAHTRTTLDVRCQIGASP